LKSFSWHQEKACIDVGFAVELYSFSICNPHTSKMDHASLHLDHAIKLKIKDKLEKKFLHLS